MSRFSPNRIFYGWFMVAAAFGVQLLTAGVLFQSYGAYVAVLQEEKSWSKTALAGAFSLTQWPRKRWPVTCGIARCGAG